MTYGEGGGRGRGGFGGGGSFGARRSFAPVKVDEEIDVRIEAVGEKGDGIAKVKGFVLFIPGAKEGEECRVKVTRVLKKVGFADKIGEAQGPIEESQPAPEAEPEAQPEEEEPAPEDSEDFGEEEGTDEGPAEEPAEEPKEELSEDTEEEPKQE